MISRESDEPPLKEKIRESFRFLRYRISNRHSHSILSKIGILRCGSIGDVIQFFGYDDSIHCYGKGNPGK